MSKSENLKEDVERKNTCWLHELLKNNVMAFVPDLVKELPITRVNQINPQSKHVEFKPVEIKNLSEMQIESLKQQKHIERLRSLTQTVNRIYGGMVIVDYNLRKLGTLEVISYLDETAVANQPLEQRLSMPTTFVHAVERDGKILPLITLFHQKYINPVHVFVNDEDQISRVAVPRDDVRNLNEDRFGNLTDFFADYPLDYVQDNQLFVQSIQALRMKMGF